MADEIEVKLKVTQVYRALYGNQVENLDDACTLAGISRSTLYNWQKDFSAQIDAIKNEVAQSILARQREREDYLERAMLDAEARLRLQTYAAMEEGTAIILNVLRTAKPFIQVAAYKELRDSARNGLRPDKSRIEINTGERHEELALPEPATRPYFALPDPATVKPAVNAQLAVVRVDSTYRDGTKVETETRFPDVIEQT